MAVAPAEDRSARLGLLVAVPGGLVLGGLVRRSDGYGVGTVATTVPLPRAAVSVQTQMAA